MSTTGRGRRLGALALLVVSAAALVAPGASAAEDEPAEGGIVLRTVDTTAFPEVRVVAMATTGQAVGGGGIEVLEDGDPVAVSSVRPLLGSGAEVGLVVAIDTSSSMQQGGLDAAKAAATAMVAGLPGSVQVGVVEIGDDARPVQPLTRNRARVTRAIDRLGSGGGSRLWEGVAEAVELFDDRTDLQANIVLVTDGADTGSIVFGDQAIAGAVEAKAAVFTVGLASDELDAGPLALVASSTGAGTVVVEEPSGLAAALTGVSGSITSQFELAYRSGAEATAIDLEVRTPEGNALASVNVGTISEGRSAALRPSPPERSFFGTGTARVLGLGLGLSAVGLLAYSAFALAGSKEKGLDSVLRAYTEAPDPEAGDGGMSQSQFMQRAVAMTEDFATRRGFLPRVAAALERADLPLRAAEALFFYGAAVVLLGILALVLLGFNVIGLAALVFVVVLPPAAVNLKANLRRRKFTSTLPDTLQLLSGSLRAGYSLLQGVEAVSQEVQEPMGKELRRVIVEARLGRKLEESLDELAVRMASPDFAWAVMAIRIQREVGGNLAELLMTVAETMTERERLRREVKGLTAEGRMSAIVLGLLPIGIGGAIYVMNKQYMQVLFSTRSGQMALGIAVALAGFGFWWMKKVIDIKI